MTTDPALQSLFTASEQHFDDDEFTANVMKKSRFIRYRTRIILGLSLLVLITIMTFSSGDLQNWIIQINALLTTDIIDMGKGIGAILIDPINTIAGLLFIIAKLTHLLYKLTKK